jgi:hypothetical protein
MFGNVLLQRLFPDNQLQNLQSFLSAVELVADSSSESLALVRDDDGDDFKSFLQTTLLVRNADCLHEPTPLRSHPTASMTEVRCSRTD